MTHHPRTIRAAALAAALLSFIPPAFGQTPAAPPAQGAPPPGPSGAIQRRAAPPARILDFKAEPSSIRPGESATLIWATENPNAITIEPDLGRAAPRGSRRVTPAATTTYTLSVTGPNGTETRSVTVTVVGTSPAVAKAAGSAASVKKDIPRTADGKPDLSGVYGYGAGGRGAPPPGASGLPTTPTLKPGAENYKVVRAADDTGQYAGCLPPGIPQTFFVPYYMQIVQAPTHVVIAHEYLNLFRIIPTDGRPHPLDPDPSWMGNPVARWEGDTLVVDSIGFNDKTEISGYRHTEALHVVERFQRIDYGTLQYDVTIEDPNVFAGPWAIRRTFPLLPEYDRIEEFVCENNREYKDLFDKK
jgi:hypothetical protein